MPTEKATRLLGDPRSEIYLTAPSGLASVRPVFIAFTAMTKCPRNINIKETEFILDHGFRDFSSWSANYTAFLLKS